MDELIMQDFVAQNEIKNFETKKYEQQLVQFLQGYPLKTWTFFQISFINIEFY